MMLRCWFGVLFCLFLAAPGRAQEALRNRCNPVRLQLVGPLETVTIRCGSAGETRIELPLLKGEKRSIQVPLPIQASLVDPDKDLIWQGAGSVRWPQGESAEVPKSLSRSNLPLPVVPERMPVLAVSAFLALLALALLLFFLRHQRVLRWGVSVLGCVLLFFQVGTVRPGGGGLVRIFEIGSAGPWRVYDSARHSMFHTPGQSAWVSVKPAGRPLVWLVTEVGGRLQIEAQGRGSLLRRETSMQPGMRTLTRELNALGNLQQVWVREDSGHWTARGVWAMGTALPGQVLQAAGPPGWLVAGLPQGPEIWVARFADGAQPGAAAGPIGQAWLRAQGGP